MYRLIYLVEEDNVWVLALSAHWLIIVCVIISSYQRHVSGTQESSSRHHFPQLSPHGAREIGEFPLVECAVIHYHMQGRSEQAGH